MRFTTIVGVDARHLQELRVAWPTWEQNCPAVTTGPILFVTDLTPIELGQLGQLAPQARLVESRAILPIAFPPRHSVTQRELMLSAIAHAPRLVETELFLKLDTDTLAFPGDDALLRDHGAAIVAPRWNYTKPGCWIDTLDRWADAIGLIERRPAREVRGGIAMSRRIISYAMVGQTSFARELLDLLGPDGRLPVPSQDTFLWYGAELLGRQIVRLRGDQTRWRHCGGSLERMRRLSREALA